MDLNEVFKDAFCGITFEKKRRSNLGIRPKPWVELTHENAQQIRYDLLNHGINSTIKDNRLRIQGVTNCDLLTRFYTGEEWWIEALNKIKKGDHLTQRGLIRIVHLRNQNNKTQVEPKWTIETVADLINKT